MSEKFFSSKKLFAFEDNAVPPFIRDCLIGLISPFEKLFADSQVPGRPLDHLSDLPDPNTEPEYPVSFEYKRDWIEWVFLEVKARLQLGVRYYNFRGKVLSNTEPEDANSLKKREPVILFLRKFRKVGSMAESPDEDPADYLKIVGASQVLTGFDTDTTLRGEIERRFPLSSVLWIANPIDALSLSGYLTSENQVINSNSIPFVLTPMYGFQNWRQSAEYLIRASDAIIIANISKEGGIGEEQELIYAANAMDRTFVTNPENLDPSVSNIRVVGDLTEETLKKLEGGDITSLAKLAGWGHWAGFESLEYARQYLGAIDELWGANLDSGKKISPGYFASLFTAMMALTIFRGELNAAATFAQTLAYSTIKKNKAEDIEFLRGPGKFNDQDNYAVNILLQTSKWYSKYEKLYRQVVGFSYLEGKP